MDNLFKKIEKIIPNDIKLFQDHYKETLNSKVKLINTVVNYISKAKGKQLRPILLLLCSRLCSKPNENTYNAAALIELLHVATLVHDDIVDEANIRRGLPSINRVWKNKISLLIGDYMFSKALENMIKIRDFDALELLSNTAKRLSEGEILQVEKAIKKNMSENIYFEMIKDKTASLFSASCKLGAITVSKDEAKRDALEKFGLKLGIVFQMKDDLFDILGQVDSIGKPIGFDVKKNMLTLPLIHLLSKKSFFDKKKYLLRLKTMIRKKRFNDIKNDIISSGAIEYTEKLMKKISNEAKQELNVFPSSVYKTILLDIVDYNITRNK
tara:strand:- start:1443 stop:2420 length:978 start_codon:yes stop_codon:yes gene_type:complete